MIYVFCAVTILGGENLDMDMMSEAADLPISPLVTINEADISALQLRYDNLLNETPWTAVGGKGERVRRSSE